MAYLDHQEAYEDFKESVLSGIKRHFPVAGSMQTLELKGLEVKDLDPESDDIKGQHAAKVSGDTWSSPVMATLLLKDNKTGRVVQEKTIRVAELPRITRRYSYIVDGQEYQVDSQWQLKPGVYTRRMANGELESRFNVPTKEFKILFDPATKQFNMNRGKSKAIPVYPLMKALGVDDDTLEKTWGKEIFAANKQARGAQGALEKFYRADRKNPPADLSEANKYFVDTMTRSQLDPSVNKITLGKEKSNVDGETLLRATDKMLQVQAGAPEDDRDSLEFKNLRTTGDYAFDKITDWATGKSIRARMLRQVNHATDIRQVVKFGMMNDPIKKTFKTNTASRISSQINPLEMTAAAQQTTIMGPGGIQSKNAIANTISLKLVNPSHMGFLDPIKTPEADTTGIILRLPTGVKKVDGEAKTPLYNIKTGKVEYLGPSEFSQKNVVLPDQVTWKDGKPAPKTSSVQMSTVGNKLESTSFKNADYVMRHPSQMFSLTTNLIPFLGSTSGNRATYAGFHLEQAISLKNREAPLVQVGTGIKDSKIDSFEGIMGRQAGHVTLKSGQVTSVKPDTVTVKTIDGKSHEVQLYNNFPLNDPKSVLHSTPTVKVGDKVTAGDSVADTNFTKDGKLALGTNLRVAYVPYKGYNFEDGVVISRSAASKLTSEHLYKEDTRIAGDAVRDVRKFRNQHQGVFSEVQYKKLGDDGVVRVGETVQPGDPLVIAMNPYKIKDRVGISAVRKSLSGQHTDASLRWKSDYPGKVVAVHSATDGTMTVHVRTEEPMQVGDKLCYDGATDVLTTVGWVPISSITTDHHICTLVDGQIVYQQPNMVVNYPEGGRMYRIKSQQVDLFVTAEHEMYVQLRGRDNFELLATTKIAGKRASYKKNGEWSGHSPKEVILPQMVVSAGQGGVGQRTLPEVRLPIDLYMILLGAYLSNGHSFWDESSGNYGIGIDKHRGFLEPLLAELTKYGIQYTVRQSTTSFCDRVIIRGKQLAAYFSIFGESTQKFIPQEVFGFSKESLKVLFTWLMWGDGSYKGNRPISYHTSSTQLADGVQQLALHIGYAANINIKSEAGWQTIKGKECWCERSYTVGIVTSKLTPTVNHGHAKSQKVQEEYFENDYKGPVYCVMVPGHVLYVRRNGKGVWSGNTGRHGNKGITTAILEDKDMPRTKDGKHVEVLLNPSGVPGRMNIGQVLETAAAKIVEKTGKPYVVNNFDGTNAIEKVKAELKSHGIPDQEELIDPGTGHSLGKALVGLQYMLKLVHQIDKKVSVRSGMASTGGEIPEKYDNNLIPSGSGKIGAQSIGHNGIYTLLAYGAKANIREMQTWKSEGPDPETNPGKQWRSQHSQVWQAIQTGEPLPTPTTTFAFQKFTDMLKAAGINIEKQGNQLKLLPFTDKQILSMSNGEIKKPGELTDAKPDATGELRPRKGGLFDPKITGGHGGKGWGHIKLPEPVPNPVFEGAIRKLTGLKEKDYLDLVTGSAALNRAGKIVALDTAESVTGGTAIKQLLDKIDTKKELASAEKELSGIKLSPNIAHGTSTQKVDQLVKKVKYLRALDQMGVSASEAYITNYLPVIPPAMRPVSIMNGAAKWSDMNKLYQEFGQVVTRLDNPVINQNLTDEGKKALRADLYDGLKAITGMDKGNDEDEKGILRQISGTGDSPKHGYFQRALLKRKQDLTMRSTIIPEPALGLDEVGLPKDKALSLYKPFVVRKLVEIGAAPSPLTAQKLIQEKDNSAFRALELVAAERPVLLKRDPALHKHSIQAFRPKLVHGKAIQIHPLVTGGFNADFDGNCLVSDTRITLQIPKELWYKVYGRS